LLKDLKSRRDQEKKDRTEKRKALVANAEKYNQEYEATARGLINSHRQARAAGNFFVPAEPRVVFAIRTRG
jgi:hypothetical protein